ncbi:MAG: ABC transporter permease [Saprospiraceae bacterium]|nr:ABC transporter permease [Saprospiraceae bacterium]
MLIKIAWRNIWRSKKRSVILAVAISLGLWTGIFLIAFYNGMIEQRVDSAIRTEISHIQLHHPDFKKDYDIQFTLKDAYATLQKCKMQDEVQFASARLVLQGMIASTAGSHGVIINGVLPQEENLLTRLESKLVKGNYFDDAGSNEIILSQKLLHKLKLSLHKKAILTFQDKQGNLASAAFRIKGLFQTNNTPYDETNVFVQIRDIDSLAGVQGELNEIALLLHSNDQLNATTDQLKKQFQNVEIKNWMEIAPEIGFTVTAGSQMVYIYMGIILLALAFGIINTMMMSVLERTREIGMLLSLGMNKMRIFSMILLETFFLILAGCPVGILLAFITISVTRQTGIDFSHFSEVYSSFGYSSVIYPSLKSEQFFTILFMVLITAFFSSLFPAQRALKLKPAASIKI